MSKTLNDRINDISEYFKGFNIAGETSFVFVAFPSTWSVLDESELNAQYNVYTGKKDGGIYFITETKNGTDCLFDAVDHVIATNKTIEEKQELLQKKANELTELFVNEHIERLRTLKFVFGEEINTVAEPTKIAKNKTKKNKSKTGKETTTVEQQQKENKKKIKSDEKSETMSFLEDIVNNK